MFLFLPNRRTISDVDRLTTITIFVFFIFVRRFAAVVRLLSDGRWRHSIGHLAAGRRTPVWFADARIFCVASQSAQFFQQLNKNDLKITKFKSKIYKNLQTLMTAFIAVGFKVGWWRINSSMAVPRLMAVSPKGSEFRRRRIALRYFVDNKTLNNFSNGLQSINALNPRSFKHNAEKACGKWPKTSRLAGTL